MWSTGAAATLTLADGKVTVFAAVDHCTAGCLGIHAVKRATRFQALEPLRQGVREHFGAFGPGPRPACGSATTTARGRWATTCNRTRFLGIESSPAFVRQPGGNGCIEHFFLPLKEQLLWVRRFQDLEELQLALRGFRDRYNRQWLIERLGLQPPRQPRERLLALQPAA